jgi:glutamine synthetase
MVKEKKSFVDSASPTPAARSNISVPVSVFDEDKFTSGHAFDGSSIAGWKGIEASDMPLMPGRPPQHDPFTKSRLCS